MVRHSKAKEAMFPYPANTISGTFFWKEVAPKAPSGLGSEAMVDPCLHPRDNLRACLPPVTIGTLQGQESPPISHYSFQDILEGELPVWVTLLAACVWPQSEIQVLSSFLWVPCRQQLTTYWSGQEQFPPLPPQQWCPAILQQLRGMLSNPAST